MNKTFKTEIAMIINLLKLYKKALTKTGVIFSILLGCQLLFWSYSKDVIPSFRITPYPPTKSQIKLLSMGDEQFYYRKLAFNLQMAGNKFGHVSWIEDYDYEILYNWFLAVSEFDTRSNLIATIATNFYSITRNEENLRYIALYMKEYAKKNTLFRWRPIVTGSHIAYKDVGDLDLALQIWSPLRTAIKENGSRPDNIPIWAEYLGFLYANNANREGSGDLCFAAELISLLSEEEVEKLSKDKNAIKDFAFNSIIVDQIKIVKENQAKILDECGRSKNSSK